MTGLYTCKCQNQSLWNFQSPEWKFCLEENLAVKNLPFAIFCGILNNIAVFIVQWMATKLRFKNLFAK